MRELKPGDKIKITSIKNATPEMLQKIIPMGIMKNTEITICRFAPFKELIQIRLGSSSLGIKLADLMHLDFEFMPQ